MSQPMSRASLTLALAIHMPKTHQRKPNTRNDDIGDDDWEAEISRAVHPSMAQVRRQFLNSTGLFTFETD